MTLVASSATSPSVSRSGPIPAAGPFDSIPPDVMTTHAANRLSPLPGGSRIYPALKIALGHHRKRPKCICGDNVVSCEYLFWGLCSLAHTSRVNGLSEAQALFLCLRA